MRAGGGVAAALCRRRGLRHFLGKARKILAMRLFVGQDARKHQPNLRVLDGLNMLAIEVNCALLGLHIKAHILLEIGGHASERSALHRRLAAQFDDQFGEPVEMTHLLPGDGLDLKGNVSLTHGIGVQKILHESHMLPF